MKMSSLLREKLNWSISISGFSKRSNERKARLYSTSSATPMSRSLPEQWLNSSAIKRVLINGSST
jgi:hypothetical protein